MLKSFYSPQVKAFLTAFLQVMFVCSNTVMIAKVNYAGIAVCSFGISFLWTMNVRAALGSWELRIAYCLGATSGAIFGVLVSNGILK